MEKNHNQSKNIKCIILYSIGFVTALFTLLTIYNSYTYISDLVENKGLVINEQLINVIMYYMNASMPYVFYTIVIWSIGYIIYRLDKLNISEVSDGDKVILSNSDLEKEKSLDDLISTLRDK